MAVEDSRQSPMMGHMLDALGSAEDIGHYGRLVFAMIGRHFVGKDDLVGLLTQDHHVDEQEMKGSCSKFRRRAIPSKFPKRSMARGGHGLLDPTRDDFPTLVALSGR